MLQGNPLIHLPEQAMDFQTLKNHLDKLYSIKITQTENKMEPTNKTFAVTVQYQSKKGEPAAKTLIIENVPSEENAIDMAHDKIKKLDNYGGKIVGGDVEEITVEPHPEGFAVQYLNLGGLLLIATSDTKEQAELISDAIEHYISGSIKKSELKNTLESYTTDEHRIDPEQIIEINGKKHIYDEFYGGYIPLYNDRPLDLSNKRKKAENGNEIIGETDTIKLVVGFDAQDKPKGIYTEFEFESMRPQLKYSWIKGKNEIEVPISDWENKKINLDNIQYYLDNYPVKKEEYEMGGFLSGNKYDREREKLNRAYFVDQDISKEEYELKMLELNKKYARAENGGNVSKIGKKIKDKLGYHWGKIDFYEMPEYSNVNDLIADVLKYFRRLESDLGVIYADEMKKLMVDSLNKDQLMENGGLAKDGKAIKSSSITIPIVNKEHESIQFPNEHDLKNAVEKLTNGGMDKKYITVSGTYNDTLKFINRHEFKNALEILKLGDFDSEIAKDGKAIKSSSITIPIVNKEHESIRFINGHDLKNAVEKLTNGGMDKKHITVSGTYNDTLKFINRHEFKNALEILKLGTEPIKREPVVVIKESPVRTGTSEPLFESHLRDAISGLWSKAHAHKVVIKSSSFMKELIQSTLTNDLKRMEDLLKISVSFLDEKKVDFGDSKYMENLRKIADGPAATHKYKLGDKYRSDFDSAGMLKKALTVNYLSPFWSLSNLEKLYTSMSDNNYSKGADILWNIISDLKTGKNDEAQKKYKQFHEEVEEYIRDN